MRSIVDIKDECCSLVLVVIVDAERLVEERNDCLCADEPTCLLTKECDLQATNEAKPMSLGAMATILALWTW